MRIHSGGAYATDISATCCVVYAAAALASASAAPLDGAADQRAATVRLPTPSAWGQPEAQPPRRATLAEGLAGGNGDADAQPDMPLADLATPVGVLAALAAMVYRPYGVRQLEQRFVEELELSRAMAHCLAVREKRSPSCSQEFSVCYRLQP
jgi:hypothetical protein